MLEVLCIVNGPLQENCYVVHNGIDALIIDPGSEEKRILTEVNSRNLSVKGILVTHYHFDHVGSLDYIRNVYPKAELIDFKRKGDVKLGVFDFKIVETYGHTMDSVSFYFDKNNILFTGDFLFKETIGNFNEENELSMLNSLNVLKYMSNNVAVYPGHGPETTVGHELQYNPFLRGI